MLDTRHSIAKEHIYLLLILMVLFFVKGYLLLQKDYIHIDESASFTLSCSLHNSVKSGKFYTSNEFISCFYNFDNSVKSCVDDLLKLRFERSDSPHSNLYYSILRIFCIGCGHDIHNLVFRGEILNVVFFLLSFFVAIKIINIFTDDIYIKCIILLSCYISSASLSNTIFIREYQMQETFILFFSLKILQWIDDICHDREFYFKYSECIFSSLSLALLFLSGYFSIIFVAFLTMYFTYVCFRFKAMKMLKNMFFIFFIALSLSFAIDPFFLSGIYGCRGIEAIGKFSLSYLLANFIDVTKEYFVMLFTYIFSIVTIPIVFFAVYKKIYNLEYKNAVFFICMISMFVILYFAPYKRFRYIMALIPILIITSSVIFCNKKHILHFIFFLSILCTNFNGIEFLHIEYNYSIINTNDICIIQDDYLEKDKFKLHSIAPFLKESRNRNIIVFNSIDAFCDFFETHTDMTYLVDNSLTEDIAKKLQLTHVKKVNDYFDAYKKI